MVRAVEKLKVLGGGFGLTKVGAQTYVRSVPGELNIDSNKVLQVAQVCGKCAALPTYHYLGTGTGMCECAAALRGGWVAGGPRNGGAAFVAA